MLEGCSAAARLVAAALDELDRSGNGDTVAAALLTAALESLTVGKKDSLQGV